MAGINKECELHKAIEAELEELEICLSEECEKNCFLGKGGYGKVFRGAYKNGELNKVQAIQVAVKKIENIIFSKKEIEILRQLRHDNIVWYYGSIVDKDQEYWY